MKNNSVNENVKKRIKYIDIAKAIAMIIIVIGHTLVHSKHCSGIFWFLYSFNVALFFILSGITFKVNDTFGCFVKKKFLRIMIPYFIWAIVFIIPYLIFGKNIGNSLETKQSFELLNVIKNTLYGNGINNALKQNTSLWFLPALFSMECIYYFVIKIANDKYDYIKFPILITIGFLFTKYFPLILPWGINSVIQIGAGTFYVGYLLKKYNILDKIFNPGTMLFLVITGIIIYIINDKHINYVDYKYGNYFLTLIIGICFSIITIYISYIIKNNKKLEYIGKNTMGILIFHKIIILIFQTKLGYISKLLKDSNLVIELFLTIIIVLLSITISIAITTVVRKICPMVLGEKCN